MPDLIDIGMDVWETVQVHLFKDRIPSYEMINEPRSNECFPFNQQNIELGDYIEVVSRTVETVHQEYPAAKIVVGGTVLFHEDDYLFGILESDIMPLWTAFRGIPSSGSRLNARRSTIMTIQA